MGCLLLPVTGVRGSPSGRDQTKVEDIAVSLFYFFLIPALASNAKHCPLETAVFLFSSSSFISFVYADVCNSCVWTLHTHASKVNLLQTLRRVAATCLACSTKIQNGGLTHSRPTRSSPE